MNDLQNTYARCEIKSSDLFAIYRETVTTTSSQVCLAKTPNRHNKLYVAAEPLSDKLTDLIDSGKLRLNDDVKERQKILCGDFGWDASDTQQIWSFGPDNQGSNILVDVTEGVQYLNEIRDNINSTFQWVTKEGVLAGENLRSVRMNLVDAVMHSDAIHRGAGQIMPTARRAFFAAELAAKPRIQEPVPLTEITVPGSKKSNVYKYLSERRGIIVEEEPIYCHLLGQNQSISSCSRVIR